jgi:hypothetical protein
MQIPVRRRFSASVHSAAGRAQWASSETVKADARWRCGTRRRSRGGRKKADISGSYLGRKFAQGERQRAGSERPKNQMLIARNATPLMPIIRTASEPRSQSKQRRMMTSPMFVCWSWGPSKWFKRIARPVQDCVIQVTHDRFDRLSSPFFPYLPSPAMPQNVIKPALPNPSSGS